MIPYEFSAERFSRWMAYVLRHNPERYVLQPDPHGYVDFDAFMRIAQRRYPALATERLRELITASEPARFEVSGGRLRARYGHSIPVEPAGLPVEPPPALYYGLETPRAEAALADGLQPSDRRMLHISGTAEDAAAVARRRSDQPAILRVLAPEAARAGVAFYREGKVYLAAAVPAAFLRPEPLPQPVPPTDA